ncbi:hypothetical protein [Glaciecola sp. SC05]|uniref:hypothetical protein n=1 Tax=Glaciecola sp. SC05 TaxID=1987355 RepID=UPI003526E9A0
MKINNKQPYVKTLKIKDVTLHPDALEAFLFSRSLSTQVRRKDLPATILNQANFEIPIACIVYGRVQIFANWKVLHSPPVDDEQSISVLVFNRRLSQEIEYQAWLYVFSQFSFSLHKQHILGHLCEFLDNCPIETQKRLFKNYDSSRSASALSTLLQVSRSSFRHARRGIGA